MGKYVNIVIRNLGSIVRNLDLMVENRNIIVIVLILIIKCVERISRN